MPENELHFLGIGRVARLLRQGKVACLEVVEAAWDRIDRVGPGLNAFITLQREESLLAAREADRLLAGGQWRGPLHGIPVSLKDLYDTEGVRTTGGSRVLAERVPTSDSTVTRRLREAGAIIIGKANMSEFACGGMDHAYGSVANPWDITRFTGGSSSGSGASVAAGLNYASMGSDTGGSIRMPAAFCGVVGLKPTYGRVSRHGVITLSWTLDHTGPLTRGVGDAAIVLQAIAGHDPEDLSSSKERVPNFSRGLNRSLRGRIIGVPREPYYKRLHPDVAAAMEEAQRTLRSLGARLRRVSIPHAGLATEAMITILHAEGAAYHWGRLSTRLAELTPAARGRMAQGLLTPAVAYIQAHRVRALLIEEFRQAFRQVEAMVLPTTARPAQRLDEGPPIAAGEHTAPFNLTGLPALSLPCGFTSEGLPIGMQVVARPFDEATALNIGRVYESATVWHNRRPPL